MAEPDYPLQMDATKQNLHQQVIQANDSIQRFSLRYPN
jgi:hypothetical protein